MSFVYVDVDSSMALRVFEGLVKRTGADGFRTWLRRSMHGHLVQRLTTRFASEGDDASGKWLQLAEHTGVIRTREGFGAFHPINVRTGAMRTLLQTSSRITGTKLEIPGVIGGGKMIAKLATAQHGNAGARGRRAAPPRPVLALSYEDASFAEHSLETWIMSGGVL